MAWTDLTTAPPDDNLAGAWQDTGIGNQLMGDYKSAIDTSTAVFIFAIAGPTNKADIGYITRLEGYNVPGFDDGYQPCSTPSVIKNNIDEGCDGGGGDGGGGSTRPTSGMIYPRGQG